MKILIRGTLLRLGHIEVMASDIPLKVGGNLVTKVSSSKLTEGTNNNTDCREEGVGITAELHNGEEEFDTPNERKGDPKNKRKGNENPKNTVPMRTGDLCYESPSEGDEKWHLHFDVTDSNSTSDNYVSEDEASERNGDKCEKLQDDNINLLDNDADDSVDFLGFEMNTASSEDHGAQELTKLIGKRQNLLSISIQFNLYFPFYLIQAPMQQPRDLGNCHTGHKQEYRK